jgi:Ser/Thr protein kinase RdoA (MazF antagonist)
VIPRVRLPRPGTFRDYLRARSGPPAIPIDVVTEILSAAGLGRPRSVRNLVHGWRTSVVEVATGDGRFVVRRYPDRWSDSAIEHEQSILLELAQRRFPAPRLVGGGDGISLWVEDGARYSVQTFETGVTLAGFYLPRAATERLQRIIGGVLVEFHGVMAGFVPRGSHHLGVDPETGLRRRDLQWHLEAIDRLGERGEIFPTLIGTGGPPSLRSRLIDLDQSIEEADLPRAIIHGDYGLHNIILRRSGEAVVHDFELSRPEIRLLDVAASLSRIRPEFRSHFLGGVRAADGMEPREMEMLPAVWEWYRIRGAVQSADAYTRLGGEHRRAAVAKRLAEAADLRSGRDMVPN